MTHVAGRRFLDVHTGSSAGGGGEGGAGLRIEETTDMGEKYVVDVTTGEKFIRGSRRPDGTYRKDIRVRPDYVPLDERRAFQTRQQLSRSQRAPPPGGVIGGGGLVASSFPPGYSGPPVPLPSRKSKARSGAAAAAPVAAAATIGGGSDAGGKRSRGKKTDTGSKEGAAGAVSPQQQQKKEQQKQSSAERDAADIPMAKDVENQLAGELESMLRFDGDISTAGCSNSTSGSQKATGGDETRHGVDGSVALGTEAPKTPEELRRRVRIVKKRLSEIEILRAKVEAGASISEEQKQKLQRIEPLKKELETLEKQLQMDEKK